MISVVPQKDRRTYLGSHDTSAIIGDNPFLSPMQVYLNKLGLTESRETTEPMKWGLKAQPMILDEYAERIGLELEPERFIRHDRHKWFGGTPDGTVAGEKRGVDAKNIRYADPEKWGDEGSDKVPRYILWQCHHFLTLMDYDSWDVAVLIGGQEFRIYTVHRDRELSQIIVEEGAKFWKDHIVAKNPPPIDGSKAAKAYLDRTYKDHSLEVRAATLDEVVEMEHLKHYMVVAADYDLRIKESQNKLKQMIGDDAGIVSEVLGKITWKKQKGSRRLDTKAFKAAHPDLFDEFSKQGDDHRVFRPHFKKDN